MLKETQVAAKDGKILIKSKNVIDSVQNVQQHNKFRESVIPLPIYAEEQYPNSKTRKRNLALMVEDMFGWKM